MELRGNKLDFGERGRRARPWRILFYVALIIGGIYFSWLVDRGTVQPLFLPTPTATRNSYSHAMEAKALFFAGDLGRSTEAYQYAVDLDPENAHLWAEFARVLIYFSELKPSYSERIDTLLEAKDAADLAVELDPDDSFAHAVRALAYDWLAAADEVNRQGYLTEASSAAEFARFLASDDAFALAVYAEVQVDLQKYAQASQYAELAADTIDAQSEYAVDVYRIYGTVMENLGAYNSAIEQYMRAAEAAPNLTFLYIRIGVNYRRLNKADDALTFFNKAAEMNNQLEINDPIPYLAIARTYLQMGEFFISALNVERALAINPANPDIYGLLGVVFYKARNYESSISVLRCAVDGCTPEESVEVLCEFVFLCGSDPMAEGIGNQVQGLDLNSESLVFFYTYGSALAFYTGSEGYEYACGDADRVFNQLMNSQYGRDPIVAGIVAEGRSIMAGSCGVASAGGGGTSLEGLR